jgi:SAM-dependent methyltransferase
MVQQNYDLLAAEYYDPQHKTCRNFDATTREMLAGFQAPIPKEGPILEVGCGRGRSNEFLGIAQERIVHLDSSRQMLGLADREKCFLRVHADACSIPFFDDEVAAVVGFLVDAFLGLEFLSEAYRVLRRDGFFLATTPTPDWGRSLRGDAEPRVSYATFVTKSKAHVSVPSVLIPSSQLEAMLRHVGFGAVSVTAHCLPRDVQPISPDIESVARKKCVGVNELPILYLICARKD